MSESLCKGVGSAFTNDLLDDEGNGSVIVPNIDGIILERGAIVLRKTTLTSRYKMAHYVLASERLELLVKL